LFHILIPSFFHVSLFFSSVSLCVFFFVIPSIVCLFASIYFTLSRLPAQDFIPVKGRVQTGSRAHPASYPMSIWDSLFRGKAVRARTWLLTFIEVKNAWSQTSIHHTYSWRVAELSIGAAFTPFRVFEAGGEFFDHKMVLDTEGN
jgi:hypothetical protein